MKKFFEQLKANRHEIESYIKTAKGTDKQNMIACLGQMRSGKSIATIGALCPLLWISILMRQSIGAILFNFCHSLIYVAIGLFMYFNAEKKGLKLIRVKRAWKMAMLCALLTGNNKKRK